MAHAVAVEPLEDLLERLEVLAPRTSETTAARSTFEPS